ncbi:MAG: AMIN domain-containing protein [Synechococcales cyanobacterium RM1_1_8]|nr:AMIN domain-containing protein [Synechococcales cyanobacterium RM1_1_8]
MAITAMQLKRSVVSLLGAGLLGGTLAALPAQANSVASYSFDPVLNQFSFTTDTDVLPTAQLLTGPTRMVIDLPNIRIQSPRNEVQTNKGQLRAIRLGQFQPNMGRIVLEFAPTYQPKLSDLNLRGLTYKQWVLEMPNTGGR